MGKHRGYRVTPGPNGTFKAWPWDPHAQKYARIKSGFHTASEAKQYALDESAKFRTKLQFVTKATTRNLAEAYQKHLADIKRRSGSHLRNVRRAMAHLVKACPDPKHPRTHVQAAEYLAALDVSARTKVQFLVTIKAMGNWAVLNRHLPENPWTRAETEDPGDPIKEQFTIGELRAIVAAIDDPFWWDAVTYVYTGIRRSESATVLREEIDLGGGVFRVIGKGRGERRKERLVPIQDEYRALLAMELQRRPIGPLCNRSVKQHGDHFDDFLRRQEIAKGGRSVHSWRHSYAGLMTASGEPSAILQAYLGHSSPKTTAHYSALASRYRQAVHGWERGQFQLLRGAASPWPKVPEPTPTASGITGSGSVSFCGLRLGLKQHRNFFQCPDVIRDAGSHGRGLALKAHVNAAEVVVHEMQRDRVL